MDDNANVFEFFADLHSLIRILEKGAESEIYIAKYGVKIAKLTLLPEEERVRVSDEDYQIPEDFDHVTKIFIPL